VCQADAEFLSSERPEYETLHPQVRIVDLFAGCGGLTLGVAEAARRLGVGIEIRLSVDIDDDSTAVYKANFPGAVVHRGRVEKLFTGEHGARLTVPELKLRKQVGRVDILVGGPPCQGHSDLNNRTRRADSRNALYARMARAAEVLRPSLVLIENVPTVTHDVEKVVDSTVNALVAAHYVVAEAVIDISRLGAPQRRRRHVVLASQKGGVDVERILSELELRCAHHPVRSARWAIEDLEDLKSDKLFDLASVPSTENAKRIAWLFKNRKFDLPNHLRPECHQSEHSYNSMYGRLRWNQPAQTMTTGFGSMGQGRYVHPSRRRTITPHEAARLQMLPDFLDFSAVVKRGSLATLIGNAVPPVLAAALIEPALRSLGIRTTAASSVGHLGKAIENGPTVVPAERRNHARSRRSSTPASSSDSARKRMQSTRQRDTEPELALRRQLHRRGLRYLVDRRIDGTKRRADIVFRGSRVAVYVDGCFWHSCPEHATIPKENRAWWVAKFEANRKRDLATDDQLRGAGWKVLRFWEHEDPSRAADRILDAVGHGTLLHVHPQRPKQPTSRSSNHLGNVDQWRTGDSQSGSRNRQSAG
jgi:DNA (cytosine-5)-methyltransferase 1